MFGSSPRNAANAYSKVGMETGVFAADPHKLILMLFDGALMAINNSIHQMGAGQIAEKGRSISHAVAIVERGLRASLNKEVGGELALNLDALYGYIIKQLMTANIQNDVDKLTESKKLLHELRAAWEQIAPNKNVQNSVPERAVPPQDALAPRKSGYISV